MRKKTVVFIVFTILLVTACGTLTWVTFTSPDGSFTADMPGEPEEKIETVDTAVGSIDIYTYLVDLGGEAYTVNYSDFPADLVAGSDPYELLNGFKDGVAEDAVILSQEEVTYQGYPALEILLDSTSDEIGIRVLLVLKENRLFQVLVAAGIDDIQSEDHDPIFNTFTIND